MARRGLTYDELFELIHQDLSDIEILSDEDDGWLSDSGEECGIFTSFLIFYLVLIELHYRNKCTSARR